MEYLASLLAVIGLTILPVQSALRSGRKRTAAILLWCSAFAWFYLAVLLLSVVQNYSWSAQGRGLKAVGERLESGQADLVLMAIDAALVEEQEGQFIGGRVGALIVHFEKAGAPKAERD